MAERDLDSYLEGIGIDIDGDREAPRSLGEDAPPSDAPEDTELDAEGFDRDDGDAPPSDDEGDELAPADDDGGAQDDDIDFERAMAGVGLGGVVPDDLAADQRAETFLVQLLLYLDPTYAVDVTIDHDGSIHADVHGGDG